MERLYGHPDELAVTQPMTSGDMAVVKGSMKNGRAHDITLYIRKGESYIFIAKPFYPPGLFRAPSGGVHPDEDFIAGAKREAMEETGVEIELERYILRIRVCFESEKESVLWVSHIFTAKHVVGEIDPQDLEEIREARLIHPREIPELIRLMRISDRGGLVYRAFLTTEAGKRL